ncbi:MAG: DNA repair protein RadA [Bdellovibrionota bacterium]
MAKSTGKNRSRSVFVCQSCGAQRAKYEGRCSDCGAWNSLLEETIEKETATSQRQRGWNTSSSAGSNSGSGDSGVQFVTLDKDIEESKISRALTGFGELDRVLGGGLVEGSFILLGGDPGIGKSTLLLQMAGGLAKNGLVVLYVSGEESVNQSAMRAQRLGVRSGNVHMASESNLESIRELAKSLKPDVLIVDSIQSVFLPEIQSAPGSVTQIRESAAQLMGLAKGSGIAVFLIGHVTKEGNIAGPKVLEHMVDTVLSFEGDQSHQFRLLRALKNRFGATHELGVFSMDSKGLAQVDNPSELFLEERGEKLIGSAVFCSVEGTRPLLCEVQALTNSSHMPQPRRTSLGFDVNRVHLLVAVLNKHLGMKLSNADVFINVVGGLRLIEPAADLAVAAALISTEREEEIDAKTCFFGEIGLTGEIRAVSFADGRLREADKLGFKRFVMPASNKKNLQDVDDELKKQIVWVKDVHDLARQFGGARKPTSRPSTNEAPKKGHPPTPSVIEL